MYTRSNRAMRPDLIFAGIRRNDVTGPPEHTKRAHKTSRFGAGWPFPTGLTKYELHVLAGYRFKVGSARISAPGPKPVFSKWHQIRARKLANIVGMRMEPQTTNGNRCIAPVLLENR